METTRIKTIGVLSDTHLSHLDTQFRSHAASVFSQCDPIVHAGDLTNRAILDVFRGKNLYAVHGNMCSLGTRTALPESITFAVEGYKFGLYHGDGLGYDIETGLIERFNDADCIIFGHTHRPLIQQFGPVLLVNPGSFRGSGKYGSRGTYAIITINHNGLSAATHFLKPGP